MDSEWSVLKKNSSLHKKTQKNSEDYSLVGELQNPLVWGSHQSWKAGDHNMAPFVLNWDFEHKRNGWEWLHMETALWSERGRAHTDSTYIPDTHTLLGWYRVRWGEKGFCKHREITCHSKSTTLNTHFRHRKKKKKKNLPLNVEGGNKHKRGIHVKAVWAFLLHVWSPNPKLPSSSWCRRKEEEKKKLANCSIFGPLTVMLFSTN